MSYEITEDGNSKSACYAYVVTGYLNGFTKAMKDADGTEPTLYDFMEEIVKIHDKMKVLGILAGVGQVEQGQNGTRHFQAYFQFHKKQKFKTFRNKLEKAGIKMNWSLQDAQASKQKNVDYCTKPTGEWQYQTGAVKFSTTLSEEPIWFNPDGLKNLKGKGTRSDLNAVNKAIDEGMTMAEIAVQFPNQFVRCHRGLEKRIFTLRSNQAKAASHKKLCFLLFGPSGTGKTTDVLERTFPEQYGFKRDVFIVDASAGKLWFDGYNFEKVLLIDELTPNQLSHTTLCRLLDDTYYRGEIKQGHTTTNFQYIFITSNYPPSELFVMKHTEYEWEGGVQIPRSEWVQDEAVLHRFNALCDYSGKPNYRKQQKKRKNISMVSKSVASLLPATLELGTKGDEVQCGSERVQPSPNSPQEANVNGKKKETHTIEICDKSDDNFGTTSDGFGTNDAKKKELKDYA